MKLDKQLLTPLRRENRGVTGDPQYSPYFPSHRYVVFHDYGHPDHLAAHTFRTKSDASAWVVTQLAEALRS